MTWHNHVATNYAIVLCHCISSLGLLVFQAVTRKIKATVAAGVLIFAFIWNASAVFPSLDRVEGTSKLPRQTTLQKARYRSDLG